MARKLYVLSLEIYKIINLPDEKRKIDSTEFLNNQYNKYIKLYEESNLLKKRFTKKDQLASLDESLLLNDNKSDSSSSYNPTSNIIVNDNDSL